MRLGAFAVVACAACGTVNDHTPDAARCTTNAECAAPTAICNLDTGACVECLDATACGPDQLCDPQTHSCRGCTMDAECPDGFCAPDTGTCKSSIIPKFVPDACTTVATLPSLTLEGTITLNADDAATCNGGVVAQTGGPSICVVRYGTITAPRTALIKVTGGRALALVADDDLALAGALDASANATVSGAGGGGIQSGG